MDISFRDGEIHAMERTVPTERGHRYLEIASSLLKDSGGRVIAGIEVVRDVTERRRLESEREMLIGNLQGALAKIKTLKGGARRCETTGDTGRNSNITFAITQMLTSLTGSVRNV